MFLLWKVCAFLIRHIWCGTERISIFEKRDKEYFLFRYRNCGSVENMPYKIHSTRLRPNANFKLIVPICCEVSSNERTLNLHFYRTQHSTLPLSTINLIASHNSYRRNTQQAVSDRTHTVSVPATDGLYLMSCVFISYFLNLNALDDRSRNICIDISLPLS